MQNHVNIRTGKTFPRGLRPSPRHVLARAMPFRKTAVIPAYFFIFPKTLSMWLNDTYGDCVTAEEAFNKACGGIFIEDATVMTWAQANGVLNGADLEPVIQQMQASGFAQDTNVYGDGSPLTVDYTDAPTLQAAIYQAGQSGGSVKIGIAADQLPSGAGNAMGWFLTSDSPDQNEDHCVGLCGFGTAAQFAAAIQAAYGVTVTLPSGLDPNTQGYAIYTWKTIGFVTPPALINMTGEAWLRNPSQTRTGTGTPTPVSIYISQPTPTPTPIPPSPTPTPTPSPAPTPTPTPSPTCNRPIVLLAETILAYIATLPAPAPSWLATLAQDAELILLALCPSALQKIGGKK